MKHNFNQYTNLNEVPREYKMQYLEWLQTEANSHLDTRYEARGNQNYADTSLKQMAAVNKIAELTNKAEQAYKAKKYGEDYNLDDLRMSLVEA